MKYEGERKKAENKKQERRKIKTLEGKKNVKNQIRRQYNKML